MLKFSARIWFVVEDNKLHLSMERGEAARIAKLLGVADQPAPNSKLVVFKAASSDFDLKIGIIEDRNE